MYVSKAQISLARLKLLGILINKPAHVIQSNQNYWPVCLIQNLPWAEQQTVQESW